MVSLGKQSCIFIRAGQKPRSNFIFGWTYEIVYLFSTAEELYRFVEKYFGKFFLIIIELFLCEFHQYRESEANHFEFFCFGFYCCEEWTNGGKQDFPSTADVGQAADFPKNSGAIGICMLIFTVTN
jgi:hypothetical protein